MRHESGLLLWMTFPVLAIRRECSASPKPPPFLGVGFDTLIRLAVWAFLAWNLIRGDWAAVSWAAVTIAGLGLAAVGLRWYANRKSWRQRWMQN